MSNGRLDYIPGDSFFHTLHVVVKFAFMLSIMIFMFSVGNILVLGFILIGLMVLYRQSGVPWSYFKSLKVLIPSLLIFLIGAQALWYSGNQTPMFEPIIIPFRINFHVDQFQANAFTLYYEGLLFGVVLAFRMLGMFLTFPLIFLTTPTAEYIAGLTEAGLPYQIAFIFTTAFRFIPTLLESRERVMDAQRLRGIELEKKGIINSLKQTVPTIVPMILTSLRMTTDLEVAIESRAFGAYDERVNYRAMGITRKDKFSVVVIILGSIIAAIGINIFFPGRGI